MAAFPLESVAGTVSLKSDNSSKVYVDDNKSYHYSTIQTLIVKSASIYPDVVKYSFSLNVNKEPIKVASLESVKKAIAFKVGDFINGLREAVGEDAFSFVEGSIVFSDVSDGYIDSSVSIQIVAKKEVKESVSGYLSGYSKYPEFELFESVSFSVSDELMNETQNNLVVSLTKSAYSVAKKLDDVNDSKWLLKGLSVSFNVINEGAIPDDVSSIGLFKGVADVAQAGNKGHHASLENAPVYVKAFGNLTLRSWLPKK